MLPSSHRLKNRKVFNTLFQSGKTFSNDVLVMKISAGEKSKPSQFGFGVSSKIFPRATKRNQIKRWMREAVRLRVREIQLGQKVVFLINPKFPKDKLNFNLIQEKVENLLKEAKIL